MVHTILFPSSFFDGKKIDEDMQNEYEAAIDTGMWEVVLFSYEKWFHDGVLVLSKEISSPVTAVYRGWMMKEEQYASFYRKLQEKGITLVTDPKAYRYFHYFPHVYDAIRTDTPKMRAVPLGTEYSLPDLQEKFDRFMVKDYVKSVKGTAFPKYFTKDTTEGDFRKAMELFYQYRGELLSGGVCFKEYVDLARYGETTNEYRVFYIGNEIPCRAILRLSRRAAYWKNIGHCLLRFIRWIMRNLRTEAGKSLRRVMEACQGHRRDRTCMPFTERYITA